LVQGFEHSAIIRLEPRHKTLRRQPAAPFGFFSGMGADAERDQVGEVV